MKQHDQKQLIEELIWAYGYRGLRVHHVKEEWPQAVWLQEQRAKISHPHPQGQRKESMQCWRWYKLSKSTHSDVLFHNLSTQYTNSGPSVQMPDFIGNISIQTITIEGITENPAALIS